MRIFPASGILAAIVLTVGLLGCGSDEGTATSAGTGSKDRTVAETTQAQGEPDYPLPAIPAQRAPLKKLVVKDLEVGTGPVVRPDDEAVVRYVGVFWKTGKLFSQHWGSTNSITLDEYGPGWEKGLQGMRVGGRREFWVPGALVFDGGTDAAYVVSLVGIKPGGTG
ncbi:MAG TPA: FKBP-type peptidyl-prolyl cis-trans isomerase [Solirubrobacterales bacterium]